MVRLDYVCIVANCVFLYYGGIESMRSCTGREGLMYMHIVQKKLRYHIIFHNHKRLMYFLTPQHLLLTTTHSIHLLIVHHHYTPTLTPYYSVITHSHLNPKTPRLLLERKKLSLCIPWWSALTSILYQTSHQFGLGKFEGVHTPQPLQAQLLSHVQAFSPLQGQLLPQSQPMMDVFVCFCRE